MGEGLVSAPAAAAAPQELWLRQYDVEAGFAAQPGVSLKSYPPRILSSTLARIVARFLRHHRGNCIITSRIETIMFNLPELTVRCV